MNKKNKVSFDFDDTLSRKDVEDFAGALVCMNKTMDLKIEIWICTQRFAPGDDRAPDNWNDELFKVVDRLKIPKERIIFAAMRDKWEVMKDIDFIWHLDDDFEELDLLNKHTSICGISSCGNNIWKTECMRLLSHLINEKL